MTVHSVTTGPVPCLREEEAEMLMATARSRGPGGTRAGPDGGQTAVGWDLSVSRVLPQSRRPRPELVSTQQLGSTLGVFLKMQNWIKE